MSINRSYRETQRHDQPGELAADDFAARRYRAELGATRYLTGHGGKTQASWLRELADWIETRGDRDPLPDRRGTGPHVSLYKGLGGPACAILAGPEDLIVDARRWRLRHGGHLPSLFPIAVAGRLGLERYLPQMEKFVSCARIISLAIESSGVARTYPIPAQTNAFQVFMDAPAMELNVAVVEHAEATGVWSFRGFRDAEVPGWAMAEFTVGEATLSWAPEAIVELVKSLRARARDR